MTSSTRCRLESINKKIDIIVNLTAIKALQGRSFEDRVRILNTLNFEPKEIIKLTGKTQEDVYRELRKWKLKK